MAKTRAPRLNSRKYLGLDLAGAKNQKTTLAALEYFPNEEKIFLVEVFESLGKDPDSSSDEVLLELVQECSPGVAMLGVNVPLTLPPCISCTRKTCPLPEKCTVPAVKWMRNLVQRTETDGDANSPKIKTFTPYTQRPIELWIRYGIFPKLDPTYHFDIDEALGGNKAPLTARMHFLQRHLKKTPLIETLPKLSLAILCNALEIPNRLFKKYRHLEFGPHARSSLIESIADGCGIFIYERDQRKLAQNLSAFDAFLCAYTALLFDTGHCVKTPKNFPHGTGWIEYPKGYA